MRARTPCMSLLTSPALSSWSTCGLVVATSDYAYYDCDFDGDIAVAIVIVIACDIAAVIVIVIASDCYHYHCSCYHCYDYYDRYSNYRCLRSTGKSEFLIIIIRF